MRCFACERELDTTTLAKIAVRLGTTVNFLIQGYHAGSDPVKTRMLQQKAMYKQFQQNQKQWEDRAAFRTRCWVCDRY
jgi:hypothetical protein